MSDIQPPPDSQIPITGLHAAIRRAVFLGVVTMFSVAASLWLADLFWRMGYQKAHYPLLAVFIILNGLLTLGSFHAMFGALEILASATGFGRGVRITAIADAITGPLIHRHAVVMPVYNEDSTKTCARIEAIYRSIQSTGHLESFDFFILSDTRELDLWIQEETAWTNLCRKLSAFGRIYYRRRPINENRKAGNIGDFVRTWGGAYESMLVLDADSLMDGGDIVKMTRVMEARPNLGILQTPPRLIRGASIFTRLQQFAMRLYGPLFIRGLNFWQLGCGSYWGHNALIRLKPFSEFCELPALPGREPFGGRILSHDFVEAALMVAEGWEVWLAWDIQGTYEEAPPTLVDHLVRDRRWMQGNLQHMWLIFARKLPFPTRMHIFMGIMAYLGSPLWFLFLLLSTWVAYDRFSSNLSRLPFENYVDRWFGINGNEQMILLTIWVGCLLFLPKILAVIFGVLNPSIRRSFGGGIRIIAGAWIETIISMLLAPSIMVSHTLMVISMIIGRSVGWGNQNRETDGTAWRDAMRVHAFTTLLGFAWASLAWYISPCFAAWMSPILAGMILSIPISVWTSRVRYGKFLGRYGILSTPEEIAIPDVIRLADEASGAVNPALDATVDARRGVIAAVVDPYVNGVHVSLLEQSDLTTEEENLAERCLTEGTPAMSKSELTELLYSAPAMLLMHRAVWLRSTENIHPVWTMAVDSYRRRLDHIQG